ncbi:MAG: GNAT family N-acetyltransferase [Anaerolineae bacterium]|jgi:GNAT superfamily N-acetyltransferase|nr:GNAT family N-acetyltransferase [Anaerolineae bacterium]
MKSETVLKKAAARDAATLAEISKRAFDSDVACGAPGLGGPPGYDSPQWQRDIMRHGDYYKILLGARIVGGLIVFRKAPREYELGRIFIDPEVQQQGIGMQAVRLMEAAYPLAKRWTLDTPVWNTRTNRFYPKMGYVKTGEQGEDVFYHKTMSTAA